MRICWTVESIQLEASKYKSRKEFEINNNKAYAAARKRKILDKVCSHMKTNRTSWTEELIRCQALKYKSRGEFQVLAPKAYHAALRTNILDKVCFHMIELNINWTEKLILLEALKYKTRTEFAKNSGSAYNAARRLSILDRVCSHMIDPRTHLTNEYLFLEAKKYNTRSEFRNGNHSAYRTSINRGILEDICSHMTISGTISIPEIDLFNEIKSVFPKTQKLRDRKVKILGKEYVEGFDLDIYVPELRKGIEFDGTYWHSPNGISRGRPKWPEEDIRNYHQIKDDYFASKGVQILHIREKDWLKNKEACLKKCLDFLQNS